jgi:hypothetical protein
LGFLQKDKRKAEKLRHGFHGFIRDLEENRGLEGYLAERAGPAEKALRRGQLSPYWLAETAGLLGDKRDPGSKLALRGTADFQRKTILNKKRAGL